MDSHEIMCYNAHRKNTLIQYGGNYNMESREIIGKRIGELRKKAGMTQAELADKLMVSHQAVSQWERSETLPDVMTLPVIAELFSVSTASLFIHDTAGEIIESCNEPEEDTGTRSKKAELFSHFPDDDTLRAVLVYKGKIVEQKELPQNLAERVMINFSDMRIRNIDSVFSVSIEGNVEGMINTVNGVISVDGNVEGTVNTVNGKITINDSVDGSVATVNGKINIAGDLNGDINAENGTTINCEGDINGSIKHMGGSITVNGDVNSDIEMHIGGITIDGDVNGNITMPGDGDEKNITIEGDVNGDITSGSKITVSGSIEGDVSSNQEIICEGDINGDVDTTGGITCEGDINGDVDTTGNIQCEGDINGDVSTEMGNVTCEGDISGDVNAKGNVTCGGDIEGDVSANTISK